MKRLFVLAATLLSLNYMFAQDTIVAQVVSEEELSDKPKNGGKVTLKPYGFVRDYLYYDSRQTFNTNAGLFEQIPKDESFVGEYDMNGESEMNFLAITTRLGLNMSGVRALNADVTAKIEADFCGFTGNNFMIRLRQAYYKMQWRGKKHSLLMGQAWHPMTGDLPEVLALASGSPFQPFSRSPQLRYDYKLGRMNFTYAALWQFQYKTVGPTDKDTIVYTYNDIQYKSVVGPIGYDPKYNKIPEMFLGVDYSNNGFKIGYGLDILSIVPRKTASLTHEDLVLTDNGVERDENGNPKMEKKKRVVNVSERLTTFSPMLYVNYAKNKFSLKAKPFCISSVNARAALPSPLTPCSLKTLMASMMPLNGATTNLRTALPTPITPWMILLMRPDEPRKADTFPMRSTRMSTTLSRMPERKSITGCKASIPFFKAAVAFSSSLTASASFITRETRIVKVAMNGDLARYIILVSNFLSFFNSIII